MHTLSHFELACDLHPYQELALNTLFQRFHTGQRHLLLLAPPGSGKTLLGLACVLRFQVKTLILSPNTTLQYQWMKQFETHGISFSEEHPVTDVMTPDVDQRPLILSSTYQQLSSAYRQGDQKQLRILSDYDFIILDECHHVLRKWGEAILHLDNVRKERGQSTTIRLGLTATAPVEVSSKEQAQLRQLLGDVDYEISLPAMIRSGHLAPFQDLVYLVRPSAQESLYIHSAHEALHKTQQDWSERQPSLAVFAEEWLLQWQYQPDKDLDLYLACLRYLHHTGLSIPDIAWHPEQEESLNMDDRAALLGAYALKHWQEQDEVFQNLQHTLDLLGYRFRQGRFWPVEGQVEKVLGLSSSKLNALVTLLKHEYASQHDRLRCLVLTDFALTHAPGQRTALQGIEDPDAGGALRLFRTVCLENPELKPFLMTGRYVLCSLPLLEECLSALRTARPDHTLQVVHHDLFAEIQATPAWSGKDYVSCLTQLFSEGKSLCLIGTRGLLGEGWDCPALNTLIDFTRTTTFVSVNQIRGRSLRKDPQQAFKVANQWDVVALLPELESGLKDLERWQRKHRHYYGLCDDGLIEKGVGHVHASFTRQDPRELFLSLDQLNDTMLARAEQRLATYDQWQVGKPYRDVAQDTLQITGSRPASASKSISQKSTLASDRWPATCQQVSHLRHNQVQQYQKYLKIASGGAQLALWSGLFWAPSLIIPLLGSSLVLALLAKITGPWQQQLLTTWVDTRLPIPHQPLLEALGEHLWQACLSLERPEITQAERLQQRQQDQWQMLIREDGTLRFISQASPQRHAQWQIAFQELLAPLQSQRYWLSFTNSVGTATENKRWFLPVPFLFGRSRERAHLLQTSLLPVLGETQLHYTKQGVSKALSAQYQGQRALPVQLQHISIWS